MASPVSPAPCRSTRPGGCSTITVDGVETAGARRAPRSSTRAARNQVDTPTLCYAENLTPMNACRVCVVEVEGARTLVPACSRTAEDGMVVTTDTERVQRSRKLVMEFLASSVEMDLTSSDVHRWMGEYEARPERFGAAMPELPAGERDAREPGHHHEPADPTVAEGVAQPVKIDNELYVRDYSRCILCYKCVEACGVDAQNTFAIAVAGRGFDARISTEYAVRPRRVRLRVLRQLHRRVPHRRADVHERARDARGGHLARAGADRHEHDLSVLRRRLRARAARAGQRDREGDEPRGPLGHERAPVHQGPVRVRLRAVPQAGRPDPAAGPVTAGERGEPDGRDGLRERHRARRRPLDAVRRRRQAGGDLPRRAAAAPRGAAPRRGDGRRGRGARCRTCRSRRCRRAPPCASPATRSRTKGRSPARPPGSRVVDRDLALLVGGDMPELSTAVLLEMLRVAAEAPVDAVALQDGDAFRPLPVVVARGGRARGRPRRCCTAASAPCGAGCRRCGSP